MSTSMSARPTASRRIRAAIFVFRPRIACRAGPQNFGTETYRNLPGQKRKLLLIITMRHRPQTMSRAALDAALRQGGFTGAPRTGNPASPTRLPGFCMRRGRRSREDLMTGHCRECKQPLLEIDHFGERLIGCIDCNRWSWRGGKQLFWELPEDHIRALREKVRRS